MVESLVSIFDAFLLAENAPNRQHAAETIRLRLKEVDHELSYTKEALCDLIQALQSSHHITPPIQAIIDRYDRHLARLAHLEANADVVVAAIDELMQNGKDIEALRRYHAEAGAIWDRCHEVIGWWSWLGRAQKRQEVMTDLRRKMAQHPDCDGLSVTS